MAATFWQRWLSGAAVLGAACAVLLWYLAPISASAALTTGIAVALCAPSFLVAASFLVAVAARAATFTGRDALYLIRAFMSEVIDFNLAILAMMVSKPATSQPSGRVIHRPVLLIHGFVCNHRVWERWLERLEARGFGPIRVIDLEPPFAEIEHHAAQVERELRALYRDSGQLPVDIIAHSMGGLVARAVLRSIGPDMIGRIVTLATPHHGTALARLFPHEPLLLQMVPGSAWLNQLNAHADSGAVRVTSIYSLEDNLVLPARSAVLPQAHSIELRGIGHLGVLFSDQVIDQALHALAAG